MSKLRLLGLVDADYFKYLLIYDIERMYKQGLDPNAEIPESTVIALIEKRITKVFEDTSHIASNLVFLFSGRTKDNHRSFIAETKKYKGHRKYNTVLENDAEYRNFVEEYIKSNYNYWKEPDLEADDLCTMAHKDDTFIYSNDKDLRNSPGYHFDIKEKKLIKITPETGFRSLMKQTLQGDTVDNIAGAKGVGKVGAMKIAFADKGLEQILWNVIKEFITRAGDIKLGLDAFTEMYALVNLKTDRGVWTREKYADYFAFIEKVKKDDQIGDLFDML